jgi:outer membrane biosynthesis protein TonB
MRLILVLLAFSPLTSPLQSVQPQTASVAPQSSTPRVELVKLSTPVYPAIARALITGDVRVQLSIRSDGSVESATLVSGDSTLKGSAGLDPTLERAALDVQHDNCPELIFAAEVSHIIFRR